MEDDLSKATNLKALSNWDLSDLEVGVQKKHGPTMRAKCFCAIGKKKPSTRTK
jgi:hypothetical protein